ncbi:MAG: hypothetical protein GC206_02490 [Alphaproteobacteria bacterium]|nr:hypothetical protein [Alphaproteobacteria bacterium]
MEQIDEIFRLTPGDYRDTLRAFPRRAERPKTYGSLLSVPITHDSPRTDDGCYPFWEEDHADKRHFYLGGFNHFMRSGAVGDVKELHVFSKDALELVQDLRGWTDMPGPRDAWTEFSYNQVRHAKNGMPLYFQKAAIVMLCCELAMRDRIKGKKERSRLRIEHEDEQQIYLYMSIIPACWNIDDFNRAYLDRLEDAHPGAKAQLCDAAGQTSIRVIEELADGYTVTRATAAAIKDFVDKTYPRFPLGRVRARPGKRLGRRHASDKEALDRG